MTKIKVAIIEFDYHAEVLRNTLHILRQPGIDVTVFTSIKIWEQVNWQEQDYFQLYLKEDEISLNKFLGLHLKTLNQNHIVLFNTIASNYKTWSELKITGATVLRIHNANTYFNPLIKTFKPKLTPFYVWKDSSHFARKTIGEFDWYYRKKLMNQVDHFAFPGSQITSYVTNNFAVPLEKAWTLPFGYWNKPKTYRGNNPDKIKISVIGKVDQRNRDYKVVVDAISNLMPYLRESNKHLELVLLGKANTSYGVRIINGLKEMTSNNFSITYFSGFVPQSEFDQHIAESDFFIIPTRIKTRYTIYEEFYGYTKISGSINDVIKYHKPALINESYPLDRDIKDMFVSYSNSTDLADKIILWIESETYKQIDSIVALSSYRLDQMQKTYRNTLNHILQRQTTH
ncbi:hypothetical protein [Parvicella tangerina]|uniref:Glycosyltransferase n=1 Tax=Parvicella tangerina TaxID=2829795 RepID=A0A916JNJ9_9FLAO|nr:hypothetical protein [Parvicella tangerina]CAG5081025.1 hypothetical protein CRYO30217_01516 [Parvicella tangerina]